MAGTLRDILKEKNERSTVTGVKHFKTGETIPFPSSSKIPSKYPVKTPEAYTPYEGNKDLSARAQIVQPKIDRLNSLAQSVDKAKKDYERVARKSNSDITRTLAGVSREKYRKAIAEYNNFYNQSKDEIKTYIALAEREEERYKANLLSARDAATVNGEINSVYNDAEEKHKALDNSEEIISLKKLKEKYAIDESNARADVGNFDAVNEAEKYARLQSDIDKQIEEKHNAIDKEKDERVSALKSEKEAYFEGLKYNDDFEEMSKKTDVPTTLTMGEVLAKLQGLDQFIKSDEEDVIQYLLNHQRDGDVELYYDTLQDVLSRRKAADKVERTKDSPAGIEQIRKTWQNAAAGVHDWSQGTFQKIFGAGDLTPTATQYAASQYVDESNGFGKVAYGLARTTGNMAPSILLSRLTGNALGGLTSAKTATTAAKAVGGISMGLSAAGNAEAEKLKDGWNKKDARLYGNIIGALETTLGYALGGISSLGGGNITAKLATKINAIDKAAVRIALKLGASGISEGFEEGLQEFLSPVVSSLVSGEEYSPAEIEDVMYAAMLGFLSVGLLESVDTVLADKQLPVSSDVINEYIKNGETAREGSFEWELANDIKTELIKNPDKTFTAFELGRMAKYWKQKGALSSKKLQKKGATVTTQSVKAEDFREIQKQKDNETLSDILSQENKNTPTENVEGEKVKSVTGGNANQYSLNIVHSNDQIETLNDARSLTKEQAVEYLNQAKSGGIKGHSYVPVRSDTPQVIIDTVARVGENIGNHSLVMQVRKAQQAMSTENPGAKNKAHGNNVRKHALTPEKIVDIVNNIDNTNLIVYQTNRQDKNGNALPNNVAVFVEYNDDGNEGVAVIEFDGLTSASEFVGSEAGDTNYHTVVTVFEPDTQRNGMPFDYAEEILSNPNNIELQIVRRPNERSATREKHPNTSNELPSDNTIPQTSPQVNTENYPTVSRDGIEIKPESDPEIQERLSKAKDDIERTGILSGASEHTIALARRLEKLLGVKIRFELKPIGTHKNGRYNRVEDTIYVNMSEDNDAVTQIIVHEFIHSIEGTRLHASLFRFAEKMMDRKHGKGTFNNRAHETIKDYEKSREALTLPQAQNEVVCNFIADNLLKDEETIKHFVREHRTVAERLQRLIDRVLLIFTKDEARTEVKTRLALEKANRLYKDAMQTRKTGADLKTRVDELRQKYQNGEITEEEFDSSVDELDNEAKGIGLSIDDFFKGGGDSFSISKKLESDLDAVLNGTFDSSRNEVYIGETSNFMVETIGANSLSVYMPASKAYSTMVTEEEYNKKPYYSKQDHYHGIGKKDLIKILEKSETPIVAFAAAPDEKGNSRRNRIVLVTDKKIKSLETGLYEYAVVVEEVDSNAINQGKRIKANKTITVYPRNALFSDIQLAITDGRLLDITTKGEHLFAGVRGSNPQAAIQKDVLKKNIANFWANVKWKGEKTSSSSSNITLTPMQMAFQKAGLLDRDGQLQYMQDSKNDTDNTDSYSISTPVFTPDKVAKEVVDKAESNIDIAERLPKKAHMRLREVERSLRKEIAKVYGIRYDRIPELQEGVRTLVNEYLTDGSIAESTLRGYFADFMKERFGIEDMHTYPDGTKSPLTNEVKHYFTAAVRDDLQFIKANYEAVAGEVNQVLTEEEKAGASERVRTFTSKKVREARDNIISAIGIKDSHKKDVESKIYSLVAKISEGKLKQSDITAFFNELLEGESVVNDTMRREYSAVYDYLKSTKLTLTEEQRGDLPGYESYKEFRESAGSALILGKDGISLEDMWAELRELSPGLFPESVTNTSDMAVKILEVARSLKPYKESLSDITSEDDRREMRLQTERAINELVRDINTAVKYAQGTATVTQQAYIEDNDIDIAEITDKLEALKIENRKMLRARTKTILSDRDERALSAIIDGVQTVEALDDSYNKKDIQTVYEASKEYYKLKKEADEYKSALRQRRYDKAKKYLADGDVLTGFRDHSCALLYMINPLERNLEYIGKRSAVSQALIDAYVKPIKRANQAGILYRNAIIRKIEALDISRKAKDGNEHSEAFAVQFVGEAKANIEYLSKQRDSRQTRDGKNLEEWQAELEEFWKVNSAMSQTKIDNAVEVFREIYDELFRKMNEARVRSGYDPVTYRKGYFPHFNPRENNDYIALFGKSLGFNMEFNGLPTTINGLTHTFKPGIKYFGAAEERQGYETVFDAVEGMQRYLDGVIDVIFQTDNIQNLRALAHEIRYQASDDGKKHREDRVRVRTDITEEERNTYIATIHEKGSYTLSNFVNDLEEYTNILAGKKSKFDRGMESFFGRNVYNFVKNVYGKIAANMIAWNVGSWLTNFIPLVQGSTGLETRYMLEGMAEALKNAHSPDGFEARSVWLTTRRGADDLVKSWQMNNHKTKIGKAWASLDALSEAGMKPMEWIDMFVSNSLVRGRYKQNIAKGLDHDAALEDADSWVSGLMADRSKGGLPTIFNSTNPIFKTFTQFQVEVANQYGYLFRDVPKDLRDKNVLKWCLAIFKYLISAYLFNELYEKITGRRPAFDPAGIINDAVGNISGVQLDNAVDVIFTLAKGEGFDLTKEVHKMSTWNAIADFTAEIAEELPFVSGLLGGGRIPTSSAMMDIETIGQTMFSDTSTKKKWLTLGREFAKPLTYAVLPGGGGQIAKTVKGARAVSRGGKYTVDSQGRDKLQYPITPSFGTYLQAGLFGPTATKGGQEWISSSFSTGLSAEETMAYQAMVDEGITQDEAFDILDELGNIKEKDGDLSITATKAKALADYDTLDNVKRTAYEYMYMSDRHKEYAYLADEFNIGKETLIDFLMENHDARSKEDLITAFGDKILKNGKVIKKNHDLTTKEKAVIYQIITNNKTNPYNQIVGKRIWKIMNPDDE